MMCEELTIKSFLDSTYLSCELDAAEKVRVLCHEAVEHDLRAVCVRPEWVPLAKSILEGTAVKIATVIAFPKEKSSIAEQQTHPTFGIDSTSEKCRAIEDVLLTGATELDIVLNTAFYQLTPESMADAVYAECHALVQAANGVLIKLILECDLLRPEQLELVGAAALKAGIGCLKNATGFISDGQGATPELISRMRFIADSVDSTRFIKASAGIRNYQAAKLMQKNGADIIGTSAALTIISEAK